MSLSAAWTRCWGCRVIEELEFITHRMDWHKPRVIHLPTREWKCRWGSKYVPNRDRGEWKGWVKTLCLAWNWGRGGGVYSCTPSMEVSTWLVSRVRTGHTGGLGRMLCLSCEGGSGYIREQGRQATLNHWTTGPAGASPGCWSAGPGTAAPGSCGAPPAATGCWFAGPVCAALADLWWSGTCWTVLETSR